MGINITGRYIVLAFFVFLPSIFYAQVTFNKTIDFANGEDLGVSVVELSDGYFIIGEGWGYETEEYFDVKTKYVKIDFAGEDISYKRVISAEETEYFPGWRCIKTMDGNVIFAGGYVTLDDLDSDVQLLKVDPVTGDTIFHRIYENENYQFGESIDEYSDGSLLINMYDEDYPTTLMKTNATGDITWQESYGAPNEGTAPIFKLVTDTLTLLTSFGLCDPEGFKWREIDLDGNILSEIFIEDECATYGWKSKTGDGIIGGSVNLPENLYATHIFKMNFDGEILWRYYSSWDLDTLYDFGLQISISEELPNGDMIIGGSYAANPIGVYRGFVSKINAEGDPYWERAYTSNGDSYDDNIINDCILTSDGGIILVGSAFSNVVEEDQNFWVLKLDSMGCLTPGCDSLDDAVFELPFNDEIVVFPNPANKYVVIQSGENFIEDAHIQITNMAGEIVQEEKIKKGTNSLLIQINNLSEGFYIIKIFDHQHRSSIKKLVISK